jgi:hypothetical protein
VKTRHASGRRDGSALRPPREHLSRRPKGSYTQDARESGRSTGTSERLVGNPRAFTQTHERTNNAVAFSVPPCRLLLEERQRLRPLPGACLSESGPASIPLVVPTRSTCFPRWGVDDRAEAGSDVRRGPWPGSRRFPVFGSSAGSPPSESVLLPRGPLSFASTNETLRCSGPGSEAFSNHPTTSSRPKVPRGNTNSTCGSTSSRSTARSRAFHASKYRRASSTFVKRATLLRSGASCHAKVRLISVAAALSTELQGPARQLTVSFTRARLSACARGDRRLLPGARASRTPARILSITSLLGDVEVMYMRVPCPTNGTRMQRLQDPLCYLHLQKPSYALDLVGDHRERRARKQQADRDIVERRNQRTGVTAG